MFPSKELSGSQGQDRAEPFPSGENAVMHCWMESLGVLFALFKVPIQGAVDERLPVFQIIVDIESGHVLWLLRLRLFISDILERFQLDFPLLVLYQ